MALAAVRIPSMSLALVARCRPQTNAYVAAPARRRVFTPAVLAGIAVALAAAAAIQLVRPGGDAPVQKEADLKVTPAEVALVHQRELATPSANTQQSDNPVVTIPAAELPLLRLPVAGLQRRADLSSKSDWALARAIERHPELVDGPERDGRLVVAIALHEDGRILSEAMRFASGADYRSIETELRSTLPPDGIQGHGSWQKGRRLPDGRVLLNDVVLRFVILPDNYDLARSAVRVAEIVRANHEDLMVSATSTENGRLFVFLSEDGQIQRESYVKDPLKGRQLSSGDPESVAFLAQQISTTLAVDIDQVGLIGLAGLQDGPAIAGNADGTLDVSDKLRVLSILYAWPRRAGESGPAWGQPAATPQPKVDTAAALAIVERYMPDAFIRATDRSVGQPVIVLTEEGRFIRSARLVTEGPIEQRMLSQQQLSRNARYNTTETLKNAAGQTADVMFVWEKADPGK